MSLRTDVNGREVSIHFPNELAADMLPLLISEQPELEAVFGGPVRFGDRHPDEGPRWIVDLQPGRAANTLRWDPESLTLTSHVRDADGLGATLQMFHSLVALETNQLCDDTVDELPAAIDRICTEIERGFPGFDIRGLRFAEIRGHYPPSGQMSLDRLQELVAELQDGHTAVREQVPVYNPPYAVEIAGDVATILRIPAWSDAARAGVEPGWTLALDDLDGWLARSGSAPRVRGLIGGRRAIALNGRSERAFTAHGPNGKTRRFTETARAFTLDELISSRDMTDDVVYVRMHNWIDGVGIEDRFDEIIAEHSHRHTMVIDLRGNTGGNLLLAKRMRRRFLRERTHLGTVQFTRGDGELADPVDLWAEPAGTGIWPGELVVLTDGLTYSASEDFLHGLQGLPHVTVIGSPSGGGSGRPRTLPVIPGWAITISTALTFDRNGHCIEGQGIPVDIEVNPFTEDWRGHVLT